MQETKILSLPIEITFDITTDTPESSGLMTSLRKMGFTQIGTEIQSTRLRYTGNYSGTLENLQELCDKVKQQGNGSVVS